MNYYKKLENFCNVQWRHAEECDTANRIIILRNQCFGAVLFAQWNDYITYEEYQKLWEQDYLLAFDELLKKTKIKPSDVKYLIY